LTTKAEKGIDGKSEEELDLRGITVVVYEPTASEPGRVEFSVPEELVPVFYPELYETFYYEELPVRLIYRVGLSSAEVTNILNSKSIVDRDYYVGAYTASASASGDAAVSAVEASGATGAGAGAVATFTPAVSSDGLVDTYYFNAADKSRKKSEVTTTNKLTSANASATAAYSAAEYTSAAGQVTQVLGNNGVLHIRRSPKITITKQWPNGEATDTQTAIFSVYRVTSLDAQSALAGNSVVTQLADVSVTKSATGAWVGTFEAPTEGTDKSGNTVYYSYYIAEQSVTGFAAQYYAEGVTGSSGGTSSLGAELEKTTIPSGLSGDHVVGDVWQLTGDAVVLNYKTYTLPSSGGPGTGAPVAAGCALATLSLAALTALRHRRIRRA
jgi:hypothetical protein